MLQGLILGVTIALFRLTPPEADLLSGLLTVVLGVPLALAASWECIYRILGARFGGVELLLGRRER